MSHTDPWFGDKNCVTGVEKGSYEDGIISDNLVKHILECAFKNIAWIMELTSFLSCLI